MKADVILELANGPTTNLAHEILIDKKVDVLPDILANAGGVTVSYFEWLQNKAGESWELSQVKEKLQRKMATAYGNIVETARNYDLDMRRAAFVFAMSKAISVIYERGIFRIHQPLDASFLSSSFLSIAEIIEAEMQPSPKTRVRAERFLIFGLMFEFSRSDFQISLFEHNSV